MQKNFTLVELIVGFGIIAILAALTGGLCLRARTEARKAKCLANLRQIGAFHFLYANRNGGRFCPAYDDHFNQWDSSGNYKKGGILAEFFGEEANANASVVFACPEAQNVFWKKQKFAPRYHGYGYNYLLSFASQSDMPPRYRSVKIGQIDNPCRVVMLADAACFMDAETPGPTSFLYNTTSKRGGYADFRHGGAAAAFYVDGHAATQREKHHPPSEKFSDRIGYLSDGDEAYIPFSRR